MKPELDPRNLTQAVRRSLRREHPTLGTCPSCGDEVPADANSIRLHGAFFHTRCALYTRRSDRH